MSYLNLTIEYYVFNITLLSLQMSELRKTMVHLDKGASGCVTDDGCGIGLRDKVQHSTKEY